MQFTKGAYSLPPFKVLAKDYSITPIRIRRQIEPISFVHLLSIEGSVEGANQTAVDTAMGALEVAFAETGEDVGFLLDDNTTASQHYLVDATAENGVEFLGLQWAPGQGAEHQTYRTFFASWRAEYANNEASNIISYRESVSTIGTGGLRFIHVPLITGAPRKVQVNTATVTRATQSGEAIGFSARIAHPAPLWPSDIVLPSKQVQHEKPEIVGGLERNFRTTWNYQFERTTEFVLTGLP